MGNYKKKTLKSYKDFCKYIEGQRRWYEELADDIVYYIEIKTPQNDWVNIIKGILNEKKADDSHHSRFVSSILFVFYGANTGIKTTLENKFPDNCIIMYGTDKSSNSHVLLFNANDNIHPLIPALFASQKRKIIIDTIKINVRADVPGFPDIMDITIINKYLLLGYKFSGRYKEFVLNIIIPPPKSIENTRRLQALISNVDLPKVNICLNNYQIKGSDSGKPAIGVLLPAVFIKSIDDYQFLKCPLREELWNIIRENPYGDVYEDLLKEGTPPEFIPYLLFCRRSFFDEFDKNESVEYTKLRKEAYSSNRFSEDYVLKLPFLALFLFSIYDNYFRSESLRKYKGKIGGNYQLRENDCVLSLQGEQDRKHFEIYEELKSNYDIKNLIDYIINSKGEKEIVFQKTVIAEMFECVSIAEGLLQIVENAVLHAGGGLLSMRVYSRARGLEKNEYIRKHNVDYLNSTYGESYFNYLKTPFFLEVLLSDFSDKSMPVKFIENIQDSKGKNDKQQTFLYEEIKKNHPDFSLSDFDQLLEEYKNEMKIDFFFSEPTNSISKSNISLKEFKQCYYNSCENIVHHYGLETFNAIVSARNGIFSVCGNNDYYSNADDIINNAYEIVDDLTKKDNEKKDTVLCERKDNAVLKQYMENTVLKQYISVFKMKIDEGKEKDKIRLRNTLNKNEALPGTFYRILLPLNHTRATILDSEDELEKEKDPDFRETVCIHIKNKPSNMSTRSVIIQDKQNKINSFADYLQSVYEESIVDYYQRKYKKIIVEYIKNHYEEKNVEEKNEMANYLQQLFMKKTSEIVQGIAKNDSDNIQKSYEDIMSESCKMIFKEMIIDNSILSDTEENETLKTRTVFVTCIDLKYIQTIDDANTPDLFESIIKGALLFAWRQKNLKAFTPIAIINLPRFQFIEASRIIAVCYRKDDYNNDSYSNNNSRSRYESAPVYLKCEDGSGDGAKEMVFFGVDLSSVRKNMIRSAMKSGSMSDELDTVAFILERMLHPDQKIAGGLS